MPKTNASKKKNTRNRSREKNRRSRNQKTGKRKSRKNSPLLMNQRTPLRNEVDVSAQTIWAECSDKRLSCHLSSILPGFPDNLPRCQARSSDQLSHIIWRGSATHELRQLADQLTTPLCSRAPIYALQKASRSSSDFCDLRAMYREKICPFEHTWQGLN